LESISIYYPAPLRLSLARRTPSTVLAFPGWKIIKHGRKADYTFPITGNFTNNNESIISARL